MLTKSDPGATPVSGRRGEFQPFLNFLQSHAENASTEFPKCFFLIGFRENWGISKVLTHGVYCIIRQIFLGWIWIFFQNMIKLLRQKFDNFFSFYFCCISNIFWNEILRIHQLQPKNVSLLTLTVPQNRLGFI